MKTLQKQCQQHQLLSLNFENIDSFYYLFDAISTKFPVLLSQNTSKSSIVTKFTYERFSSIIKFKKQIGYFHNAAGLHVCHKEETRKLPKNIFKCASGVYISFLFVCDGVADCGNGDLSDETFCICDVSWNTHWWCKI